MLEKMEIESLIGAVRERIPGHEEWIRNLDRRIDYEKNNVSNPDWEEELECLHAHVIEAKAAIEYDNYLITKLTRMKAEAAEAIYNKHIRR